MIPWFAIAALLGGLTLAWFAPRLARSRLWRVHGLWWPPRALSRTGQRLITIHLEFNAGILMAVGLSGLAPPHLAGTFTLVATAGVFLNVATVVLVTGPLMLLGVATVRPPKQPPQEPPALR